LRKGIETSVLVTPSREFRPLRIAVGITAFQPGAEVYCLVLDAFEQ
jgi:hypothetical protein